MNTEVKKWIRAEPGEGEHSCKSNLASPVPAYGSSEKTWNGVDRRKKAD